jgi:hypothetical protein
LEEKDKLRDKFDWVREDDVAERERLVVLHLKLGTISDPTRFITNQAK